jgi:hypothetical protein
MATKHGRNAVILWNSTDLTGYLNAADATTEVDNADTSTFGNSWRTNLAGLAANTYTFEGFHDVDVAASFTGALQTDGGVLSFCPGGGATIGDNVELVSATSTSLGRSASLDGAVALSWAVSAQTYVGFGWVLHPLGEDTNTTTGADRDDAAATQLGWTAHLHVTAVDGGSWVIKLQDAATTDWADVTGGAFTAATTATSQRLVSAAITTELRRHVRYVATRTGGSVGDGITFFLGYARSRAQ